MSKAIMGYWIDVEVLDWDGAIITTSTKKTYVFELNFVKKRWALQDVQGGEDFISGRLNINSTPYKILPKVLEFIHGVDHD